MIKMTFHLLIGLFLTLLIAGREDPVAPPIPAEGAGPAATVTQANPAAGPPAPRPAAVVQASAHSAPMPGPALRPAPDHTPATTPPQAAQIWRVAPVRINVRAGPSTGHTVIGSLARGDEALVISDPAADWVRIRIEGDGIDGWVSRRLLVPAGN